jgi:hypothetical protein
VVATIIEQLGEVYDVGAACPKRVGVPHIVDADELAEPAGPTGLDTGDCVLEDRGLRRLDAEATSASEESVRCRLAPQSLLPQGEPVDAALDMFGRGHLSFGYPDATAGLNRWLPLIKWFLAIPHYVVLFFLYIGVLSW